MQRIKKLLRSIIPQPLIDTILPFYHLFLARFGAFAYANPSLYLIVIGVTGTKGKSSTIEMINAMFEASGARTALLNSIRIKIGEKSEPNTMRMSMPGRFYIQHFLKKAVRAGCAVAILEMTSEGAQQSRHRFIDMNALVFTNLAPEHIESHGSYRAYADAKLAIGRELARSRKRPRIIVANAEDKESNRYLTLSIEKQIPFSLSAAAPYSADENGGSFFFDGLTIPVRLPGLFSLRNAIAAAMVAHELGVSTNAIAHALSTMTQIPGRAERIDEGQDFILVVDYAHTPDSLIALYDAFANKRKICVMGATGGGRDTWKRPVMGKIAEERCGVVILTNEDPYDEDPKQIVADLVHGMSKEPQIYMDRRTAIRKALELAKSGDAVLITGKGTDPNIAGPKGEKTPWSDSRVAREELKGVLKERV